MTKPTKPERKEKPQAYCEFCGKGKSTLFNNRCLNCNRIAVTDIPLIPPKEREELRGKITKAIKKWNNSGLQQFAETIDEMELSFEWDVVTGLLWHNTELMTINGYKTGALLERLDDDMVITKPCNPSIYNLVIDVEGWEDELINRLLKLELTAREIKSKLKFE